MSDIVTAAKALAPTAQAAADQAERERRLPEEVVQGMVAAGLPNMLVPQSLGGGEVHPATMVRAIEELAIGDGAAAWCAIIAATSGIPAAYMEEDAAREIFGPDDVVGGVFAPRGKATPVEGGYSVSGRWPFASGCQHCAWLQGGTLDGARRRVRPRKARLPSHALPRRGRRDHRHLVGLGAVRNGQPRHRGEAICSSPRAVRCRS